MLGFAAVREPDLPTFLCVDMADFTSTTERIGDEDAAELARRIRRAMCALSCRMDAQQVKSMGDGVMIWAHDPSAAVALARRTVREIGTTPELLPVRVGVHTGPAIRRGADQYGSAVNVAARLAAQTEPNEPHLRSSDQRRKSRRSRTGGDVSRRRGAAWSTAVVTDRVASNRRSTRHGDGYRVRGCTYLCTYRETSNTRTAVRVWHPNPQRYRACEEWAILGSNQ